MSNEKKTSDVKLEATSHIEKKRLYLVAINRRELNKKPSN
jgi:hypothetical protein